MIRWALEGVLADSHRPGFPEVRPSAEEVGRWVETALGMGIRSVLCILETEALAPYDDLGLEGGGLLAYYRGRGLRVAHIRTRDNKIPPLSKEELARAWEMFQALEVPVLVHCNAGINRTGAAVDHILRKLEQGDPSVS